MGPFWVRGVGLEVVLDSMIYISRRTKQGLCRVFGNGLLGFMYGVFTKARVRQGLNNN